MKLEIRITSDSTIGSTIMCADQDKNKKITLLIIGDSTVASYESGSNIRGWGQMIGKFLNKNVDVVNCAINGRSSKSFLCEGLWEDALKKCYPDYVFIQFGHNDCPGKGPHRQTDPRTTFKQYLKVYIDQSRKINADPVLITPMTRKIFNENGKIKTILRPYAEAMLGLGIAEKVEVVDLHRYSVELFNALGEGKTAEFNCSLDDTTHFSEKGATEMARLVMEGLSSEIKKYLVS